MKDGHFYRESAKNLCRKANKPNKITSILTHKNLMLSRYQLYIASPSGGHRKFVYYTAFGELPARPEHGRRNFVFCLIRGVKFLISQYDIDVFEAKQTLLAFQRLPFSFYTYFFPTHASLNSKLSKCGRNQIVHNHQCTTHNKTWCNKRFVH